MRDGLKQRLFRFDYEGWNNPWYGLVGGTVLAMLGVLIGELFAVHLVSSELGEDLIVLLCLTLTLMIGLAGIAIIDMKR